MISRRGFLQSIFGTAAAGLVLARLEPLTASAPDLLTPSIVTDPDWLLTFDATLAEAKRIFDETWLRERRTPYQDLGRVAPIGEMTTQFNVGFQTWDSHASDSEITLMPAMACLATTAIEDGIGVFSGLELPRAVEFAKQDGPLRMVVGYDVLRDLYITRFDVRGATTPDGLKFAQANRELRLKSQIRERLSMRGMALNPLRLPR